MSGSSYWPRSAVNAYGIAPCSRIQASAHDVSSPPENAMPTRSPTGSAARMTFALAEVGRERVRDRAVLAHPGERARRVEPARERNANAFAHRQRGENDVRCC